MLEEILSETVTSKHLLIFDLDGTLINTDKVNFLAYKEAIEKVKKLDLELLYKDNERFTRTELYSIIAGLKGSEYKKVIKIKNDIYHKYLYKSEVNNLILKIIERFSKSNEIVLATNSHKNRANMLLKYHSLTNIFDYVFYKEDYKNQGSNKFEHVFNQLNIEPNLVIVFDDDSNEIKKAIFLGIPHKNVVNLQSKG